MDGVHEDQAQLATRKSESEQIDFVRVLDFMGGDKDLLDYAVLLSVKRLPSHFDVLLKALQGGDFKSIERAAHNLKGSVSTYLCQPLVQAAFAVESYGRDGDIEKAKEAFVILETLFKPFYRELMAYNKDQEIKSPPMACK